MNTQQLVKCENPTIAKNDDGLIVAVEAWALEQAGHCVGYGIIDGAMTRLHPEIFKYSAATGEVSSVVSVDDGGAAIVSIFKDGRLVCNLRIDGNAPFVEAKIVGA